MKYVIKDLRRFDNEKTTRLRRISRAVLLVLGVFVVLYLAFMAVYFASSEPLFCATCHEVKPYLTSWRNSRHQGVKCLYCHEFRGFLGKLHSKSRGLNDIYLHMTGQYSAVIKAQVYEQNCIACHLGDYYDYPQTPRLDMKHYGYIKENRSCRSCHPEAGHRIKLFTAEKFKK